MIKISPNNTDPAIVAAFTADEAEKRIENTKVGCALVVTLMPLGSTMDYVFYHDQVWPFFGLRLACSSIAALIWALLYTRIGRQQSHWLGLTVPLLPVVFLAWIIAATNGFGSTYYASGNFGRISAVPTCFHGRTWPRNHSSPTAFHSAKVCSW